MTDDLHTLIAELRDDVERERIEMDPRFQALLDERVAQGFPKDQPARARRAWFRLPQIGMLPAAGMTIAAFAVVGIAGLSLSGVGEVDKTSSEVALSDGGSTAQATSTEANPFAAPAGDAVVEPSRSSRRPAPTSVAPGASLPPAGPTPPARRIAPSAPTATGGGTGRAASPNRPRKVERSTQLALRTPLDDLAGAASGVVGATKAAGGYVESSQVDEGQTSGTATFSLRIPTDRLDGAIAKLSDLGDVRSLNEQTRDITASALSAQERVDEARAERRGLLRSLARADTSNELSSLRARLRDNRSRLAAAKGALGAVDRRATLSRVDVTIRASASDAADEDGGGGWGIGDAWGDAKDVLTALGGGTLVAASVLVPLGLVALLAAFAARAVRRRRREAALS